MRIVYDHSHLGGAEILQVRYPDIDREIREVISEVTAKRTKSSKEKTKKGKALYSPGDMNQQFKKAFEDRGYRKLRHSYKLTIPNSDFTIPGTFKQIDFVKDKVLVEVQLGKYFSMFYDIAKFQYFYNENKAEVGVEIVPCHALYREMFSGVSYGETLVYDIEQLRRHFPVVPVKVILIDVDESD